MVVQQNTIFRVVSVVPASNVVFFDMKSFTMADGEGRNFRQKNRQISEATWRCTIEDSIDEENIRSNFE
jgi:hypothetical protein